MATEVKPRALALLTKKARQEYSEKNNIEFVDIIIKEDKGELYHEVILSLESKEGKKEITMTGDYIDLLISSEIIFQSRIEDKIVTPNYTLQLERVEILENN